MMKGHQMVSDQSNHSPLFQTGCWESQGIVGVCVWFFWDLQASDMWCLIALQLLAGEKMRLRWTTLYHRPILVEVELTSSWFLMDFRSHQQTHSWCPNKLISTLWICPLFLHFSFWLLPPLTKSSTILLYTIIFWGGVELSPFQVFCRCVFW